MARCESAATTQFVHVCAAQRSAHAARRFGSLGRGGKRHDRGGTGSGSPSRARKPLGGASIVEVT